ncbi:MAG: hypothetical protein WCR52_10585 [Bacteroidota bacterium]
MEDKTSTNQNLEDLFRQGLNQVDSEPDAETWAAIAAQQKSLNTRFKRRYYAKITLPLLAVLIISFFGWQQFGSNHKDALQQNPIQIPENQSQNPATQHPEVAQTNPDPNEAAALTSIPAAPNLASALPVPERPQPNRIRVNTVPRTVWRFKAEEGLEYENPVTGTSVHIPGGILVHNDGRPVTGEVAFNLQEYRSMSDYLASGIPMHYSDERGDYHFNSGGMFELSVRQGTESLNIAPGQQCEMRFSPTHKLTQANLFFFDENAGQWKYEASPAFAAEDGASSAYPLVVSEAVAIRDNINRETAPACLPQLDLIAPGDDNRLAQWIKDGVRTGNELALGKQVIPAWFRNYADQKDEVLLGRLEQSLIHIVHHRDHQEMFFPEDIKGIFTELKAFKGAYFVFDSERNGKMVPLDGFWDRVSVVQEQGAVCTISLLGKTGLVQFYATLVPSPGNEHFDVEKALANYRKMRDERQQDADKNLKNWRRFLFAAKIFESEQEWCMSTSEWCGYFDEQNAMMRKRYGALVKAGAADQDSVAQDIWAKWRRRIINMNMGKNVPARGARSSLTYALRLSNFGLYNCDQIFKLGRGHEMAYLDAHYKTYDGRIITPQSVSVMEKSTRLFFTLSAPNQLPCLPGRKLDFILTDKFGRNYVLARNTYARKAMQANQSLSFEVQDVTDKTGSPADWAELLDM